MDQENKLVQWGGAFFVVGNILFIVNKLNEMSRLFLSKPMPDVISGQNVLFIFVGQVTLITGYVSIYRYYSRRASRFVKNALRMFCGGGIVMAVGHVTFMQIDFKPVLPFDLFILVLLGLFFMLLGLILFGSVNLRQPVMRRWPWLPLATGLMGFIGFFFFGGQQITAVFLVFRTLFALGLIGIGLVLWQEKPVFAQQQFSKLEGTQ